MKPIPETENPLVLRTDFSDQAAWEKICAAIRRPTIFGWGIQPMEFRANVEFVDDVAYRDVTKDQLLQLVPQNYAHSFIVLVDRTAITQPESPLLIVDLYEEPGREFRAIPSEIAGIENNLSLANMSFFEFADAVDPDGVFRGFPTS